MSRWTDLAEWRPTPAFTPGSVECRGLVLHIAEGTYLGTIAWQQNPGNNVSSHFVAAEDGRLTQCVDTDDTAWTQIAGNGHWLSVEMEGFRGDSLTPQQVERAAQLMAKAHQQYGAPLVVTVSPSGRGLGHHSMGTNGGDNPTDTWTGPTWGHEQCPGPAIVNQKTAILDRAASILNPKGNNPMRFMFAAAIGGDGQHVYITDGLTYRIQPLSAAVDIWLGSAGAGPVTMVDSLPSGWSLDKLINALCGSPATASTGGGASAAEVADELAKRLKE